MNRPARTAFCGVAVAAICVGLVALPAVFNPHDDQFNQRLRLVWFLGLSMPGLLISVVLGLWARRHVAKHAVLITWFSAAVLAVALPSPAIVGAGAWADCLVPWYVLGGLVAGVLYGWSCGRADRIAEAADTEARDGGTAVPPSSPMS